MSSENKTESKAREFLLTVENRGDGLFRLYFNKFFEYREENNFLKEREQLHVIEKSFADKLQAELKAKDELLRECEKALAFYGDENKWFMRTKIIDPSKDVIFASRYNDKTGQSEAVDIKKPFEVTARLKVDQGKTAQAMLQKLREVKK